MIAWLTALIDNLRWYRPFPRLVRRVPIPVVTEQLVPSDPVQYLPAREPLIIGGWAD